MASSSSQPRSMKYDVFLSFRGEDTRNGIVSHIYKELKLRRLDPFLDEPNIRTGHAISDELVNAINQSRASIVVISKNYASSSWVLDELLEILICNENNKQMVVPVFYQVDPSDVRKQTGSFGKDLEALELTRNIEKIKDWKKALTKIASIKGYDSRDRSESDLVEEICADIWKKLHSTLQYDSDDLVGMNSHMAKMDNLLELSCNEVRMVGILGMGGIGKTTIATTVYEKIKKDFDMHCIVDDVKKHYRERKASGLQKLLLSKLFKVKEAEMEIEGVTSNVVKEKLYRKKVLIVLDDLDHLEQLRACAKDPSWFGPCSRIIITTRDAQILTANRVEHVYEIGCLGDAEALQLFNLFAFKQTVIPNGFKDLSNRALKLAHGLPLALKVLGSHLYCGSESYWESQLRKLEHFPHRDIKEVLKTSYDSLDADTQDIFLYAACSLYLFGNNYEVTEACGYDTKSEINILVQKSLISLGRTNGTFVMHDLVQQMGRSIVCGEPRRRPGNYKMLWDKEDIIQVLSDNSGTKTIEGISLFFPYDIGCHVSPEAFKGMSNLKFLIFKLFRDDRLIFPKGLDWLPKTLNYVEWDSYPLSTLPVSFLPTNLVELYMTKSHLEKLWDGIKPLGKLKKMDLSYSKHLKILPDLSNATSLESLNLGDCQSLVELPALPPNLVELYMTKSHLEKLWDGIKPLGKLKKMDLSHSKHLKILPDLSNATSLESLNLGDCQSLVELPALPPNLVELYMTNSHLEKLWDGIKPLGKLKKMDLSYSKHLKILPDLSNATSLESLNLGDCQSLVELPALPPNLVELYMTKSHLEKLWDGIKPLGKLKKMDLSYSKHLKILPDLSNATGLESLNLGDCQSLVELPALPPNLVELYMTNSHLEKLWDGIKPLGKLKKMDLSYSEHLKILPDLSNATSLESLNLEDCQSLVELPALPPNLQFLNLKHCSKLTVVGSGKHLGKLKDMVLSYCEQLKNLPDLSNATSLVKLNLINCKNLVELSSLPPNLQHLEISDCSALRVVNSRWPMVKLEEMFLSSCEHLERIPNLSNATSLEKLSLSFCESLVEISALPPNLQILDLYDCFKLQVIDTKEPMRKLKKMSLSSCEQLKVMPDLSNAISLVNLNLSYCISLVELSMLPPNLRRLNLVKCSELKAVNSIWPLMKLRKIYLNFCGHLQRIPDLSNATSLESLHIQKCESLVEVSTLPSNLRFLDLVNNSELQVVDSREPLVKLEKMYLFSCGHLKSIPDLSNATSLRKLDLRLCKRLAELSGLPLNLTELNLEGCSSLKVLDSKVSRVKLNQMPDLSDVTHIWRLNLSNCKSMVEFPKLSHEAMIGLVELHLDCSLLPDNLSCFNSVIKLKVTDMRLQEIPSSIMCLWNLKDLWLEGRDDNMHDGISRCCPSLSALCKLESLHLINLNISKIPDDIDQLHQLSTLDMSGNNLETLPVSIKNISSLNYLYLRNCKRLKTLPELPRPCLKRVCANCCTSLEQIHMDSLPIYSEFVDCFKLENSALLIVESMARNQIYGQLVCLSGSEIPEWFGPESSGISGMPRLVGDTRGFLSCILLPSGTLGHFFQHDITCDYRLISKSEGRNVYSDTQILNLNGKLNLPMLEHGKTYIPEGDHLLLWYDEFKNRARYDAIQAGSTIDQVIFNFSVYENKVERFGVRLLFKESELLIEEQLPKTQTWCRLS